jgi:hypothetical protein
MSYIDLYHSCPVGYDIVYKKAFAFSSNHALYMELCAQEREHLKVCSMCNPDLLLGQLWKNVKVREE